MQTISINKYRRADVDEVTLPTWDELNTNESPIIDAWTKDTSGSMGYMRKLSLNPDRNRVDFTLRHEKNTYYLSQPVTRAGYIYPLFVIPELNAPIGSKVFVGNIICTVISDTKALADSPDCRNCINKTDKFDWVNGWDFRKSHIYQYLNSDEFWERIDPEPSSERMADKFADEISETTRLFDDPAYDRIIGIYYNPDSTSHGQFVLETYPYSLVFEAMRLYKKSDEEDFLDYLFDNRNNDRLYDRGTEWFTEFADEWKDRTDYETWSGESFAKIVMRHLGLGWGEYCDKE